MGIANLLPADPEALHGRDEGAKRPEAEAAHLSRRFNHIRTGDLHAGAPGRVLDHVGPAAAGIERRPDLMTVDRRLADRLADLLQRANVQLSERLVLRHP